MNENSNRMICPTCGVNETVRSTTTKNTYFSEFWLDSRNDSKDWEDTLLTKSSCVEYFKKFFKGNKCFDIGFGRGASIFALKRMGLQVDGIEPDGRNVETIMKTMPGGKYYEGYFGQIEINDKYEIIWISHALEHVERPDVLLEKCKEIMKDNAVICIMVPDCGNAQMLQDSLSNKYHI